MLTFPSIALLANFVSDRYFEPTPHLTQVVHNFRDAGKRLLLVSNSPFWYVDAGMRYLFGSDWRMDWDVIITSAGKPNFYTGKDKTFRGCYHYDTQVKLISELKT